MKRLVAFAVVVVVLAAGVVIGAVVSGRAASQGAVRWEYKSVFISDRDGEGFTGDSFMNYTLIGTNEGYVIVGDGTAAMDYMNQLGAEGWELVTFVSHPEYLNVAEMMFKRPVQ